uniref:Uncharacterized protein n=1 Tax=Cucumis sativus TaxID=3659 RepID=A0A0A0L2B9_CUCSA
MMMQKLNNVKDSTWSLSFVEQHLSPSFEEGNSRRLDPVTEELLVWAILDLEIVDCFISVIPDCPAGDSINMLMRSSLEHVEMSMPTVFEAVVVVGLD